MGKRTWLVLVALLALVATACGRSDDGGEAAGAAPAEASEEPTDEACDGVALEATDTGITEDTITVEVMADTGSPLAPGIFQGNVDAVVAFAEWVNERGGIACRDLVVRTWDSKFDPKEVKNGHIDACTKAFALVGGNSVFNPDPTTMEGCGIPNVAAFAVDTSEMCSPVTVGVNARTEACPVTPNEEREFTRVVGPMRWLAEQHPGLHGLYLANGDLPSTKLSAIPDIAAQEQAGITFDAKVVQSATDPQSAYVPRVATLRDGGTYAYNGSGDYASVFLMKEALAQGVDMSKVVWACGVACYTQSMLTSGGDAVEGTYVWIQFLPFTETGHNEALDAYVSTVGEGDVDTWGAQSWQAALAFKAAVDAVVADGGPNAVTRAAVLEALRALEGFDAGGMAGQRKLTEYSPCFVLLQIRDGEFVRTHPEEPGSFDCDPANIATVRANPEAAASTVFGG